MSAQLGTCAYPSDSNAYVISKHTVLRCVQQTLRRTALPQWFSLKVPDHPNCSRAVIFSRSNHRCVYCETPLVEGVNATVDHLLPRCLFLCEAIANQPGNRVASCRECNALKGDWFLPRTHLSWQSREAYFVTTQRVVLGLKQATEWVVSRTPQPGYNLYAEPRPDQPHGSSNQQTTA